MTEQIDLAENAILQELESGQLISELRKDPYENITEQTKHHIKNTLKYFHDKQLDSKYILDLGQRSPLTQALEKEFDIALDNTDGDLDDKFIIPKEYYDVIIYSHTIEHQFSPLNTLLRLKSVIDKNTKIYIITPDRTKLLWCRGHYHEIDSYRIGLLLKRAGMKILSKTRQKVWRKWSSYIKGIRPILRFFLEYNAIYEVSLNEQ